MGGCGAGYGGEVVVLRAIGRSKKRAVTAAEIRGIGKYVATWGDVERCKLVVCGQNFVAYFGLNWQKKIK